MPKPIIRHIATSHAGPTLALAEFEQNVYVWDVAAHALVSNFTTTLDFGGTRLAITSDGQHCIVGAYRRHGIAAYAARTGQEVWRRKDLKKVQDIHVSLDDSQLYCGFQGASYHILDRETGQTKAKWRGVKDVWESAYERLLLIEKHDLILRAHDDTRIGAIPRVTFAILSVAFGPRSACVSESGGPVRCFHTQNCDEMWRFIPEPGKHVLRLAYCQATNCFVGVIWPYEHGGSMALIEFAANSGIAREMANLDEPAESEFFGRGSRLVTSDGRVWNVPNGTVAESIVLPF